MVSPRLLKISQNWKVYADFRGLYSQTFRAGKPSGRLISPD